MKVVRLAPVLIVVVLFTMWAWPSSAQDRTGERLDDLETRVADLEETVEALSRDQSGDETDGVHVITGEIRLLGQQDEAWVPFGDGGIGCAGTGDYRGLKPGGMVPIGDAQGNLISEGEISVGVLSRDTCLLMFEAEVPDSSAYIVELIPGDTVVYTKDTMEDNDWSVSITRRFE